MSSSDFEPIEIGLSAAEAYVSTARHALANGKRVEAMPVDLVHRITEFGVRLYAIHRQLAADPGYFSSSSSVSATEVMLAASAMLKSANLEVFELGMWQTWSRA